MHRFMESSGRRLPAVRESAADSGGLTSQADGPNHCVSRPRRGCSERLAQRRHLDTPSEARSDYNSSSSPLGKSHPRPPHAPPPSRGHHSEPSTFSVTFGMSAMARRGRHVREGTAHHVACQGLQATPGAFRGKRPVLWAGGNSQPDTWGSRTF